MTTSKAKRRPRRANAKGRSKTGGKFVQLRTALVTSEAFRSLSGSALKYYVELRHRYNGSNNGLIYLSVNGGVKMRHSGGAKLHH
jgi:hypothetical protein